MASTINVKISPLPRGDYSSSATYAKLDVVSYDGSSYMAIKAVPTGTVPTNTTYWQLLAEKPTIGAGSIATNMLADGAVTTAKLADGAVTDAKLAQSGGVLEEVSDLKNEVNSIEGVTVINDYSAITKLYPTATKIQTFPNDGDVSSVYIPVTFGATYTIVKKANTSRFAVGTTANVPVFNEPVIDYVRDDTAHEITFTATGFSKYALIWFRRSSDTSVTPQEALDSITITQKPDPNAGYVYKGEKIEIAPKLKLEHVCSISKGYMQGASAYGNYLFQFHSQSSVESGNFHGCTVVNLAERHEVQFIDLGFNELYHNNNASFGTQKYDANDAFPLLYVSQENADARSILVYRVTETGNTSAPFALTLVQTINVPTASEWAVVYPNACVGNDGYLYIVGWRSVESKYEVIKYPTPDITQSEVTLDYADKLSSIEWDVLSNSQGFLVYDGKLYFLCGSSDNSNLQVVNLFNGDVLSTVKFNDCGLPYEPEGVFLYNNTLGVSFAGEEVYLFYF